MGLSGFGACLLVHIGLVAAQACYYGPGAEFRGPTELVPCLDSGQSACCLLGDVCLAGNSCWNDKTGDTYQYGCTDINYEDDSCPFKCGWSPHLSPWTAMEYCNDLPNVHNAWTCQSPESCGCDWGNSSWALGELAPLGCAEMGSNARAALFAPNSIPAYLSLPKTQGGSTGYFSTYTTDGSTIWISTVIDGYTPTSIGPASLATPAPTKIIQLDAGATPAPATNPGPVPPGGTTSTPTAPVSTPKVSSVPFSSRTGGSVSSSRSSGNNPSSSSTGSGGANPGSSSSTTEGSSGSTGISTTNNSSNNSSGLSSGAKVGIGVGIGVGAGIFLSAITIYFLLSRRRKRNAAANRKDSDSNGNDGGYRADEKRGSAAGTWQKKTNADGVEWGYDPNAEYTGPPAIIHEAPSPQPEMSGLPKTPPTAPAELDAGVPLYELDSAAPSSFGARPVSEARSEK